MNENNIKCPLQRYGTLRAQIEHDAKWRADGTCSYCGSVSPDDFFEALKQGAEIIPTDKDYKCYINGNGYHHAKFYFEHMTDEQRINFIELVNAKEILYAYPGYFYRTPYFMKRKGD